MRAGAPAGSPKWPPPPHYATPSSTLLIPLPPTLPNHTTTTTPIIHSRTKKQILNDLNTITQQGKTSHTQLTDDISPPPPPKTNDHTNPSTQSLTHGAGLPTPRLEIIRGPKSGNLSAQRKIWGPGNKSSSPDPFLIRSPPGGAVRAYVSSLPFISQSGRGHALRWVGRVNSAQFGPPGRKMVLSWAGSGLNEGSGQTQKTGFPTW